METGLAADGSTEKCPRSEALEIAFAVDLEVVKEHAQWRNPEFKPRVGAHQSSVAEGVAGAAPAWVVHLHSRVLGRELSSEEAGRYAELVKAAKIEEPGARREFGVFERRRDGNVSKQIARTRWVSTWRMVDGRKSVKARLAAKGYEDPDIREGIVDTSGCVSIRSPHLRVISLCPIKS